MHTGIQNACKYTAKTLRTNCSRSFQLPLTSCRSMASTERVGSASDSPDEKQQVQQQLHIELPHTGTSFVSMSQGGTFRAIMTATTPYCCSAVPCSITLVPTPSVVVRSLPRHSCHLPLSTSNQSYQVGSKQVYLGAPLVPLLA